tara:strand:+ start:222 stop:1493 length:1272 start_codon:yes stop_codon:yes gene_type:complete
MAKKKEQLEEVVDTTTEKTEAQVKDKVVDKEPEFKVKKKPSMKKQKEETIKIDLREIKKSQEDVITKEEQKEENATEKPETPDGSSAPIEELGKQDATDQASEENKEQVSKDEQDSVLEEITDEEVKEQTEELVDEVKEAVEEQKQTGEDLPENIKKVVDFMNETGGSLEDYVKLNQDYTSLDQNQLLKEYYKSTKPHLDNDEIDFLMDDNFSYDEDLDDERDIKRKKLALKEQVANAKSHLDGLKSKYYEDIKIGSKLAPEQQKAIDFFNRYNKESENNTKIAETQKSLFQKKTNEVFSNEFKGFEYNVGEKRYRFNVKEADKVKSTQSDINNFVRKFLNDKNEMSDAKGYHKSLFTAMNPDAIASHFYEQGKADALKQSIAKSKNIDMNPRQGLAGSVNSSGLKFKVLGDDSSKLKFKFKK